MNTVSMEGAMQRKGLLESIVYGMQLVSYKFFSICEISLLKIRGYKVDYSTIIRGSVFFFQSEKHSIAIMEASTLGKHVRISCGDDGKIDIGRGVLIDDFTYIMSHEHIQIGDNTRIAAFCFITDFNHKYGYTKKPIASSGYETKPVKIGENVWIGTHVIVLPGISIGNGAVIGAGSVVTKNVPAHSVAVGNPARIVRTLKK